jgi:leucyl-tRNA synthetase
LRRVYRLYFEEREQGSDALRTFAPGEGTLRQSRLLHQTIHKVGKDIDNLAFNTAISAMMIFARDIVTDTEPLAHDCAEQFCLILAPFAPHLAEEIWRALGHGKSLAHEPWPAADESMLVEDTFVLVVQINGKRRAEIRAPHGADAKAVEALARADESVAKHLGDAVPKKVIVVPGKLVNFVV